ncbi:hypothetical protein CQW23_22082 [Capsicum baccatum]|uniref:Aspartate--tRNA ligase, chloroplastic/mitochondrial n=1 Tax=Capsicum baccatum TaxID=33114 RepID=A0A2G2VZY7_CAPBA|nr:hypothetical protein CQW23_22082 [Capsicum baccatum]
MSISATPLEYSSIKRGYALPFSADAATTWIPDVYVDHRRSPELFGYGKERGIAESVLRGTDDLILFVVGHHAEVNKTLDHLRTYIAHKLGLIDNSRHSILWVTDFPMFEWNNSEQRLEDLLLELGIMAIHHEGRRSNEAANILEKKASKKEVPQFFEEWPVPPLFIHKTITIDKERTSSNKQLNLNYSMSSTNMHYFDRHYFDRQYLPVDSTFCIINSLGVDPIGSYPHLCTSYDAY